ncbi:rac GTPase-activating protein 1-like isoform X1 [Musca domestica]|uniref:Rac GTPase-activating protein 1 isoform X1 n=1 Tax=Musca domestica TaxID=7370 RepID=A0A1I8MY47_MUSDO|nr:rac GTPase-activating protein 1 isoform X1 [Musca domestica]XP_058984823.1 rac GTPase-activating protein 1-like isoform X1 [Musca domestica]
MSTVNLSILATFDDLRRCIQVLTEGTAEEELLKILQLQKKMQLECLSRAQEAQRIQKELDASLQSMADLETKLFHARRLLEMESKARKEAEYDRDQMEKKLVAVADLLQHENNLKNETRDKLGFLHTLPRKRKSVNRNLEEKYGNEINSTGSFLSDLSITQSEDDFLDDRPSRTWHKNRHSAANNGAAFGNKRTRLCDDNANTPPVLQQPVRRSTRRSKSNNNQQHHLVDVVNGSERICATTKVSIPQDGSGAIRAESTIETVPVIVHKEDSPVEEIQSSTPCRSPLKQHNFHGVVNSADSPMAQNIKSTGTLKRSHNFVSKTFIRGETCVHCSRKIRFGSVGLRCRDCPIRCHTDCRPSVTVSCVPSTGTPTIKGLMGHIADYAPSVAPFVPALIVHCVNEIEARGLTEVGIYRVSGSEREVKALKERFLRGKSPPQLANIEVHVLCGCIKDFLRSLREPLIPTNLWKDFCNAVQNPSEEDIQKDLYKAIDALPQPNRDTLAFLILHFQRIAECREVLMPLDNIARVFGPTIVGYSSPDPDQHAIFTEVYTQYTVMLQLLKIPRVFWVQFVPQIEDKENKHNTANIKETPSNNKESIYSLYATPLKSTLKKRRLYGSPPYPKD